MTTFHPKEFRHPNPDPTIRRLKIEEDGDPWKGTVRPKIRLQGCWLEQAGFQHGHYVRVTCVAAGVIELHSIDPEPVT